VGPWQFAERVSQDRIVVEKSTHYFDPGQAKFDKIIFRIIPDAVVLLEVQPGRVPGGVFPDMVPNRPFPVLMAILGSRSLAESVVEGLPRASFQELIETSYQPNLWQSIWSAYLGWRGVEVPVSSPSRRALAELQRARVTFQPWPEKSGIVTIVAEATIA